MKQTAVEFLVEELGFVEYEGLSQPEWIKNLILQSKEMFKQQIIDAYIKGNYKSNRDMYWKVKSAEQYYNENYKQDETD